MMPDAHARFTERLVTRLAPEADVLGVVTLGSSSGLGAPPDDYSDHDFFVVTRSGAQERFRSDLSWLPGAADLVLHFRETAHGVKALYATGHLAEFAVFDLDELALARVNRYRVVLDRADVVARVEAVRVATRATAAAPPDMRWHAGQLITALVVGAGRAARGERLSGHRMVRAVALEHLLVLLRALCPDAPERDDLDPARRFEQTFPALGDEIDHALQQPIEVAAHALLEIASRELGALIAPAAHDAVAGFLVRITGDR